MQVIALLLLSVSILPNALSLLSKLGSNRRIVKLRNSFNYENFYNYCKEVDDVLNSEENKRIKREFDLGRKLFDQLKGTSIYLVGMMGVGKTSIGKALTKRILYRFLDTDEITEWYVQKPIQDYIKEKGEDEFRTAEHNVLTEVSKHLRVVIATGGGIVLREENWGKLRHGLVVHLDMSPEKIYERLIVNPEEISKRPLLQDSDPLSSLKRIYEERKHLYDQADIKIELDPAMTVEEASLEVVTKASEFIEKNPPLTKAWESKLQQNFKEEKDNLKSNEGYDISKANMNRE